MVKTLVNLLRTVPTDHTAVKSAGTGPVQQSHFETCVENIMFLSLLLDVLPTFAFWNRVVCRHSKIYHRQQREESPAPTRDRNYLDGDMFTVNNFLRLLVVVIMRDLVLTPDDPVFSTGRRVVNTSAPAPGSV